MENKILKKTVTLNGKILSFVIMALICFATYGLFYLLEITGKVDFTNFVISYRAFAILGIFSLLGVSFMLMSKMNSYTSDEPGLNYYEFTEVYDRKQYDYLSERFPSYKINYIYYLLESLRLLNVPIDCTKIGFNTRKENSVCIEHHCDKWIIYNCNENKKQVNRKEFLSYETSEFFTEFLKRLNISENTIVKIIECYEHLEHGHMHSFLKNENGILLIFDIYNKDINYFKENFSLEVNFKDINQLYDLLYIYDNAIQQ